MNSLRHLSATRGIGMILYVLIVPFVVLPLAWALFGSFKPQKEIFAFPPTLLPREFSFEAYLTIMTKTRIPQYLVNSFVVTSISTVLVLIMAGVAAYGFSRWSFPFKGGVMVLLLVCQLIPSAVTIIPYYLIMSSLNLLDTHVGLIAILTATHVPFAVWILKGQFDSIPTALDEAAIIDGCSRFRILLSIIVPNSLPGFGAAAALSFITIWAEFLVPLVIAKTSETTMISAGIYSLFGVDSTTYYPQLFAATVIATVPIVVIYLLAQKQFIAGLTGGAEK